MTVSVGCCYGNSHLETAPSVKRGPSGTTGSLLCVATELSQDLIIFTATLQLQYKENSAFSYYQCFL